jgi:hypothetical protein
MTKVGKAVSERAIARRARRKLADEGLRLRKCRSDSRWYLELGDWYLVDVATNCVVEKQCDIDELAAA